MHGTRRFFSYCCTHTLFYVWNVSIECEVSVEANLLTHESFRDALGRGGNEYRDVKTWPALFFEYLKLASHVAEKRPFAD